MLRLTAIAICSILTLPAVAQVTLDELDAAANASDAAMEEFRKRLNDPDPDRALAVLHLLVSKGDSDQRRMAVRHGLQSTDRAIRATTLRAIFDSEPTLRLVLEPVSDEPDHSFTTSVSWWGGVIDSEGIVTITLKITGFNSEEDCWTDEKTEKCLLRIKGDIVSLWIGSSWGSYELNGAGQLKGEQAFKGNLTKATIDLSE
ncbi:hypothetical protein DQW77_17700 [Roseovarius sp. TE539]|uniref:hypothetical protein n=1 Tax=Roseovarius sp. TE539 TaxID=2249812 RepID=UPI000DDC6532|nr:hypothetical protein [Roseovarius sp. TE539]RBI67287.1 hypothetical protein DQW77_17700 [Roseovarius sp. TE539]